MKKNKTKQSSTATTLTVKLLKMTNTIMEIVTPNGNRAWIPLQ